MSYLRILTDNTTWVCPRSGNYRVTCVAGGPGGGSSTTHNLGGTTSFGGYLSASGSWGDSNGSYGNCSGLVGYTLMNYTGFINEKVSTNNNNIIRKPIGFGGGGYGSSPGGVGKIDMRIMYIESGESVICTIGNGGAADTANASAGNPGVITIEFIDDDMVENSKSDNTKKDYIIRIYSNGSLYTTLYCPEGETIALSVNVPFVKGFATSNGGSMVYSLGQSITPTQNMDLYIIYKTVYTVRIYHNSTLHQTLNCTEGDSISLPSASGVKGYSNTNNGELMFNVSERVQINSNRDFYAVFKKSYSITIYHNGSMYNTLSCYEGDTVTLPSISGIKGYSTYDNAESVTYPVGSFTPTSSMNLYTVLDIQKTSHTSYGNETITLTSARNQTIQINTYGHSQSYSSGNTDGHGPMQMSLKSDGTNPYIQIGGTYLNYTVGSTGSAGTDGTSLNYTYEVKAGDTIKFSGYSQSGGSLETSGPSGSSSQIRITIVGCFS